jgi:hypothetical protein
LAEARKPRRGGNRPFDLARGPLFRARLLELDDGLSPALLTMHHIVSDGWSHRRLQREVAVLYEAFRKGEPSPLPELPGAVRRLRRVAAKLARRRGPRSAARYWKEALRGAPEALDLPADRPRPAIPRTAAGAVASRRLARGVAGPLRAGAARGNVTLFMLLLAAFDVLLHRYTGPGRHRGGLADRQPHRGGDRGADRLLRQHAGARARFADEATFSQLLAEVRESCLGAYAHQDVPFERLVQELAPERDMSRTPLFQVMFLLQNAPGERRGRVRERRAGMRRGVTSRAGPPSSISP